MPEGTPHDDTARDSTARDSTQQDCAQQWVFVYMRNLDISRVPRPALAGIWESLGVNQAKVAWATPVGAYLAEFIVWVDYADEFISLLSSITPPGQLDSSLMPFHDTKYSPIAPHAHVLPESCAVPQRALDVLDKYARDSLAKRWSNIYHSATQRGVRILARRSLDTYSLPLLQTWSSQRALGRDSNPAWVQSKGPVFSGADLVRQRAPNHAILSEDHLAELIPRPTSRRLVVYTDGAFLPDRRTAGLGAYFDHIDLPPIVRRLHGHQSNARAEIYAVVVALEQLADALDRRIEGVGGPCEIWACTDSQYVVDAVHVHGEAWRRADWTTAKGKPIANRTAFKRMFGAIRMLADRGHNVFVHHLPAHAGIAGNEVADVLAKAGSLL
ncbi:hypothetical protein GGF46_004650 [Coemansia sp. RSA 552]|nr:hypothetical protein GGF46_004650 [Coemansia sp. RSA 552]